MAERHEGKRPLEGWAVRERPAVLAGLGASLTLLALVVAGTLTYDRFVRPYTAYTSRQFPQPELERHALAPRAIDARSKPPAEDPSIGKAMRELAGGEPK